MNEPNIIAATRYHGALLWLAKLKKSIGREDAILNTTEEDLEKIFLGIVGILTHVLLKMLQMHLLRLSNRGLVKNL